MSLLQQISSLDYMVFAYWVTAWFIYQLKHESIWAGWVRTVMKPITKIAEWIKIGVKWIWKLVKRPYEKYKQNLHLQRNIYWYLLLFLQRQAGADDGLQGHSESIAE